MRKNSSRFGRPPFRLHSQVAAIVLTFVLINSFVQAQSAVDSPRARVRDIGLKIGILPT
ncbi:MAG: hypothetical protein H0U23_10250, partial [Blastocatellia bacterium]|nr:hypothetical protein [Blastocatellia bacterium]